MIKKIKLVNWKTHKNSELEFKKGTNVLVGKMGSGKTSVMNGICYALYGTFPELQRREAKSNNIIMQKPSQMDFAKVELDFEYNNNDYKIERTVFSDGKTNQAKLYKKEKLIAGPQVTQVTERLEKEIELNYELFSRAVYSEQNQIDFFLKLSPMQRKDKFDELLDLGKYEKARSHGVAVKNVLKKLTEEKEKFVKDLEKRINQKEIIETIERLEKTEKSIKEIAKQVEEKKANVSKTEKELTQLTEKGEKFKKLKNMKTAKKAVLEQLEKQIKTMQKEIEELKEKNLEKEQKKINQKIETILKEKKSVQKKVKESEKKVIGLEKQIVLNETIAKQEKEFLKHLNKAKHTCSVCESPLDSVKRKKILTQKNEKVETISEKIKELNEFSKKEKINAEKNEEFFEELETEEEKLEKELNEQENLFQKTAEKEKEIKELKKNLNTEEKEFTRIEKELKMLEFDEEKEKNLSKLFEREKEQVNSLKKDIELKKEIEKEIKEKIEIMKSEQKQLEEEAKDLKFFNKNHEDLSIFVNALKQVQSELRAQMIETTNQALDEIWKLVYPYKDFSSAKIEIVEGSYEMKVKNMKGEWIKIEGVLSGGERSAVAIAIRIAFSLVLARNIGWLILDEPTHNLDSYTVKKLSEMLREKLPKIVDQVFLITHDKELESASSASLYKMKREKNDEGTTKPVNLNS